jgi:hypothetical protein
MSERVEITVSLTMSDDRDRQNALALHLLTSMNPLFDPEGWYGIEPGSVSAFIANPTTEDRSDQDHTKHKDPHS